MVHTIKLIVEWFASVSEQTTSELDLWFMDTNCWLIKMCPLSLNSLLLLMLTMINLNVTFTTKVSGKNWYYDSGRLTLLLICIDDGYSGSYTMYYLGKHSQLTYKLGYNYNENRHIKRGSHWKWVNDCITAGVKSDIESIDSDIKKRWIRRTKSPTIGIVLKANRKSTMTRTRTRTGNFSRITHRPLLFDCNRSSKESPVTSSNKGPKNYN